MTGDNGDWDEWRRLVLDKLNRLEDGQESARAERAELLTEVAVMKARAGVMGALAGSIPVAVMLLLEYFSKKHP